MNMSSFYHESNHDDFRSEVPLYVIQLQNSDVEQYHCHRVDVSRPDEFIFAELVT